MATVNFINSPKSQSRAGMMAVMKYTSQDRKTVFDGVKLVGSFNCSPQSAYNEFVNTKLQYGKDSGRMYYHLVQSFSPDENITPQKAHEVALKLAEYYKDFEVLVCTHSDREHIHSHLIINSVSFETGKKLHQDNESIQKSAIILTRYAFNMACPFVNQSKKRRWTSKYPPVNIGWQNEAKAGNSN